MPEIDDNAPTPVGPRAAHRIDVGGSVTGPVIAGNHNVVVDAQNGSQVTVLTGSERPRPRRRERAEVLPRSGSEPVGREEAMQALAAAVRAGGPVQLWGPPGVGKTTLLRHAARLLPSGPDGVVFLGGAHRDVEDLAQDVFEACYEAPGYAPTRAELRRLMASVRVTVYVDDAGLTSDQLLELMDTAPQATFVFTGVERTLWSSGTALELSGLSQTAGLRLLAREWGGTLPESEHETAADLWEAAGGLPLPLLRAAAVARSRPEGEGGLPRVGEVAALLPTLLDQLAEDESVMGVLQLLATLDGVELAASHVGALTGVAEPEAVCDRLVRLGLVRTGEYGYGSVADTVPVVRQRCDAPFSAERLCDHFARWGALRDTTPLELAAHGGVLEKVAEVAESAGRPDLAVRLARAASPGLARSLRFGVWGRLLGHGWVASRAAGDRRAEAYFLHEEAVRALLIGRRVVYAALLAQSAWIGHELGAAGASSAPSGGAGAHAGGGGVGAHAGSGQPGFDVPHYMQGNGFGSAHSGASAGHGSVAQPSLGSGGGGSWGSTPGDGGSGAHAVSGQGGSGAHAVSGHGGTGTQAVTGDGGGSGSALTGHGGTSGSVAHSSGVGGGTWGGGTAASTGATAAAGTAVAGMSSLIATVVSLVVACALVVGLGYAVSSFTSTPGRTPSGDARNEALPTPSFSLPAALTDTPTPTGDPFKHPAGCDEQSNARQKNDERMATAPVTNPGADQAWAASERALSEDLAAAADVATDPAVKAAIQKNSADTAALATAITNKDHAAVSQYVDAVGDDSGAILNLCY
ncbi:ATP-binding protein [Streptomyces sp. NPDC058290]|uniref:ATP-binding protein n=1 Tax=Streptomyces sp. NPDC058290 TaxID=3346426 RepID=UPI0036EE6ADF